jgi:SGNH domain (fused to AT3 domains)
VRTIRLALVTSVFCVVFAGVALASSTQKAPPPGTSRQVASLVKASGSINTVDTKVASQLQSAQSDWWEVLYPKTATCVRYGQCVLGDTASKKVVVLWGDSHAGMWLPAIAPAAKKAGYKLVFMYMSSCAPAALGSFRYNPGFKNPSCSGYDTSAIAAFRKYKPSVVIIGERTTLIFSEPKNVPFTNAQWTRALESTIQKIKTRATRVAVLQDTQFFNLVPGACLSVFMTSVQVHCSIMSPNPKAPGHQEAEAAATKTTGTTLLRTSQWLCTATCSPIIGQFLAYVDQSHITADYSAYLTDVMAGELKPLL